MEMRRTQRSSVGIHATTTRRCFWGDSTTTRCFFWGVGYATTTRCFFRGVGGSAAEDLDDE